MLTILALSLIPSEVFPPAPSAAPLAGIAAVRAAASEDAADLARGICEAAVREGRVRGLSVAVIASGELVLDEGFGDGPAGGAAEAETPYPAGPLLEPMIAAALAVAREEGELSPSDRVSEHLAKPELEGDLRVEHLLAHTSGLADWADLARPRGGPIGLDAVLAFLAAEPLATEPGSCFAFSGSNVLLAARVLEEAAGEPLRELLETRVIEPLGLDGTRFGEASDGRGAASLEQTVRGKPVRWTGLPAELGVGSLTTTVADLAGFLEGCTHGSFLGSSTRKDLLSDVRLDEGGRSRRGHGFDHAELDGAKGYLVGGAEGEARLRAVRYADARLAVAVAATSPDSDAAVGRIERRIARAFLGLDEPSTRDVEIDPDHLRRYAGGYYVGCTRYAVRVEDGRLVLDEPDGEELAFRYQGDHRFAAVRDEGIRLDFTVSEDGRGLSFVLNRHGVTYHGTRLD